MYKEAVRQNMWALDRKKQLPDIEKKTVYSPLHYGDTVEISLIRGIEGETYIGGKKFELEYKNVFFIPPKHLHTSVFRKGGTDEGDMICAFHVNVDALATVVDIKKILLADNRTLFSFPTRCDDFDVIWQIVQDILDENRLFTSRLVDLIRLFEILVGQGTDDRKAAEYNRCAIEIVDWIENNYPNKLSMQTAADHFGYSKHYFCKWIKANTGTTFNEFLNAVRVNHACTFLINGYSVEEVTERCGYTDSSYFVKVFKRFMGTTPKAYVVKKTHNAK